MTTLTNNEIPSSTAIDVRYNAEKLDEAVNSDNETYQDRFGNSRFTLKGLAVQVSNFFSSLLSTEEGKGGSLVNTSIGVSVNAWLNNTVISPDMFYKSDDSDWSSAFSLAAAACAKLKLPVTLLPRTYTFNKSVDLTIFGYGVVCDASRNNKVIFKATGNSTGAEVFVSMKNVDRRKTGGSL